MPWAWVRPADPDVLIGRPLLDLGIGDGQTLAALAHPGGLVIGMDESSAVLRAARGTVDVGLVRAEATAIPVRTSAVGTVLAADLVHHLSDDALGSMLAEAVRVLMPDGAFVAWWWTAAGTPAPDAPAYPRELDVVVQRTGAAGFASVEELALVLASDAGPRTVGMLARR